MFKAHHARRLLRVAQALRESRKPRSFTMAEYSNECGTPACALGHYASRGDLQRLFHYSKYVKNYVFNTSGASIDHGDGRVLTHFGITREEAYELFSSAGCDGATTTKRAAAFIEKFVADRRGAV